MFSRQSRRTLLAIGASTVALSLSLAGCSSGGGGSTSGSGSSTGAAADLTVYIDNSTGSAAIWDAIIKAFKTKEPSIKLKVDTHPAGSEGDNLVKTRLSTGDAPDLIWYNSGSLFQALAPEQNFTDLSDQAWASKIDKAAKPTVSTKNGVFGLPVGQTFAGAVLYNKKVYASLGLQVPKSWSEFIANSEKIKAAGSVAPILQAYGDTWTSQLFVLGDYYNVQAQDPTWADKFTANKVKFSQDPARAGFAHLEEASKKGLYNQDFATTTNDQALAKLAKGEGAQYPILTVVGLTVAANYADKVPDLGTFPMPGPSADINGLTVWEPNGLYLPKSTTGDKADAAKKLMNWLATPEACKAYGDANGNSGPFVINGCSLPADVPGFVKDMQPYFDAGKVSPALEFLSPVKGPALEQITVAVGSGITSSADGAKQYDEDVKKQAQQLGLPGW